QAPSRGRRARVSRLAEALNLQSHEHFRGFSATLEGKRNPMSGAFDVLTQADWTILGVAALLLFLLIVSFRSRSYVFCQYLKTMTGVILKPSEVRRAFKAGGREGVRELFLDLIIREDLKHGPAAIPDTASKG